MGSLSRFLTLACLVLPACGGTREEVVVFAAASLQDALRECGAAFESRSGIRPVFNFAGSNTLARQIVAGAAADLYVSADERWMDEVDRAGRIDAATRTDVAGNTLVLVVRDDSTLARASPEDLATASIRGLAVAEPESVPAGRYARAALGGFWTGLEDRVIPAADVRAALALVESDPGIAGIVYRTDAASSRNVRVLYEFPAGSTPPIRYAAAVVPGGANPVAARSFLAFLRGREGREIFLRLGFAPVAGELP